MTRGKPVITARLLNNAFVSSGVARFARQYLTQPSPVFDQLENYADLASLLGLPAGDWDSALQQLTQHASDFPPPFGQLLRDYQLQLHEWFALTLAGEIEAHHLLDMALTELQSPAAAARPTLHLLEVMTHVLFGAALPPLAWPSHRLVRTGLLDIAGEGPLPTRQLSVLPELWALLGGDSTPWPGTRALLPGRAALPGELLRELPVLAAQLQGGQARVIVLRGNLQAGLASAAAIAAELGLLAVETDQDIWLQRPVLASACHYASWLPVLPLRLGPGERYRPQRAQLLQTPLILVCGHDGTIDAADSLEISLPQLTRDERLRAWRSTLPELSTDTLAESALIDGPTILALAEHMRFHSARCNETPAAQHLRAARAHYGAERLRLLAQPVTRHVEADGLILDADSQRQFDELVQRCQQRERLWQGLGASLSDPTTGVRVLFAGESGAGKTLAASRLATLLGAPLFRVDLAAVMNKYIGESEKNLGRVLDEAAALDAILLMDEADTLFGRRSDGKETGERYANMLTNFLLTRIENHSGIVVLTSNSRSRIDSAFSRRFDCIIEFPLPGVEERFRLWQSHLGSRAPDSQTCRLLASYSELPGGHIRNCVLHAAALSQADSSAPLSREDLLNALRAEYRKLGRALPPQLDQLPG